MFYRYAMIVKNLRGVVAFDPSDGEALKRAEWLSKRFRYRNIGVPVSLVNAKQDFFKDKIEGKPFRTLYYPVNVLEKLALKIGDYLGSNVLGEALVLASTYISPLLVLSQSLLDTLSKHCVESVYTCKELDNRDWKLHLRIADYTILDMYEYSVKRAAKALDILRQDAKPSADEIVSSAKSKCAADTKRYWRIKCDNGKVFMHYIDNLALYIESRAYEEPDLLDPNVAAGLAIVPAVNLVIAG